MSIANNNQTDVVGDVLAVAFLHYPVMDFAFEGESEAAQARKLKIMFQCCANAARLFDGTIQTEDKDGALLWLPGPKAPLGLWRELRADVAPHVPDKEVLQYVTKQVNVKQMGLIWLVGVEHKSQGKGYCRILMERAMRTEMGTQGMTEFWLTTDTVVKAKIYERLGFHVMVERVIQSSGLTNWLMRKLEVPSSS
ncbi:Aste57867_7936 [Aphanomyces stellatus]|uniref:Aste57867_7936 protein n=1 Tax=Aphanomyces stellatus TaxID=120398 RepID=A0A485KJ01_9STRA|nr:hypothetical protein As57867_007906 [Aphanomyces stellatus]VFT84829.1 Aste57867_7936 [Aphanomyces stellatus]